MDGNTSLVLRLGTAQTLAWASSYYLPAILVRPMAADAGVPVGLVWLAFSLALLLSAAVGPSVGRAIDRLGGRPVLMGTSGSIDPSSLMRGKSRQSPSSAP